MLDQVLWKKRSQWQMAGASVGLFIGLFLLLFALQVAVDVQVLSKGASDTNLLVLNKQFERNYGKPMEFTPEEIKLVRQQAFFDGVAVFKSNNYQVSLESQQMNFRTLLFFQSVPSQYLGVDTSLFQWQPGQKLPIMLSSDYLTLYNFGFAPSQGLPRFSAKTIGLVDFKIRIQNGPQVFTLDAFVCGFTPNINSILVPESFIDYSNQHFGHTKSKGPTQLMVSTDNPYHVDLERFLEEQGYEIARGGLIGGELRSTLFLLVLLISSIGIIILGLALLVFVLNFQVMIAQASADIQLLIQLGYLTKQISQRLTQKLLKRFAFVVLAVLALLVPIKYLITQSILKQGYELSAWVAPSVWIAGLCCCALFIGINQRSVSKNVESLA